MSVDPDAAKVPGHCTLSGKPVFDILRRNDDGSPAQIGMPHDDAYRANLLLTDGNTMAITVCEDMLPEVDKNLPLIWRKIAAAAVAERDSLPPRANEPDVAELRLDQAAKQFSQVPLGVLYVEKWSELNG